MTWTAIVVAKGPHAKTVVCGLTLAERGRRVASRSGAQSVKLVSDGAVGAPVKEDLLILGASTQVVHFPLVDAVRGAPGPRVAVDQSGAYAGAIWVPRTREAEALAILEQADDAELAARWLAQGIADTAKVGDLARHPATTAEERRGARRMLFRLVHKEQDSAVTRWLYRPVVEPLTRALLPTPLTPNMVSVAVFVLGMIGAWLMVQNPFAGSVVILAAGYLDCCDGEIARLRLEGSLRGAWFDTIADESTTVATLIDLGVHTYRAHPHGWVLASIPVATVSLLLAVYVIYYYLVVVAHSGNSQDYPSTNPLAPLLRRDFTSWVACGLTALGQPSLLYALLVTGSLASAAVLLPDHLRLRRARRASRAGSP